MNHNHEHGLTPEHPNTTIYPTTDESQTFELASVIASIAKPGQVYLLNGDLGVGKTVFAKGFAYGLGIKEPITSPTFTIVCNYESATINLNHFDLYRLEDEDELFEIGFDEYLNDDSILLIEWAFKFKDIMPKDAIVIDIIKDLNKGENYREIRVTKNENTRD